MRCAPTLHIAIIPAPVSEGQAKMLWLLLPSLFTPLVLSLPSQIDLDGQSKSPFAFNGNVKRSPLLHPRDGSCSNSNSNISGCSEGAPSGLLSMQDGVNCSNIATGRAEKCWQELDLTNYVGNWISNSVCVAGEGFASCYLRQNGFPALDCSTISVSSCPAPQILNETVDPRVFYVVYNIYGDSLPLQAG